jgi:hypothetical protein
LLKNNKIFVKPKLAKLIVGKSLEKKGYEKWSGKSTPSSSHCLLRAFWILLDSLVISGFNVAEIISFGALRVRNSLRSLERRDKATTASVDVFSKVLHIAFTSLSLSLSHIIR